MRDFIVLAICVALFCCLIRCTPTERQDIANDARTFVRTEVVTILAHSVDDYCTADMPTGECFDKLVAYGYRQINLSPRDTDAGLDGGTE